ncbi:MAG: phage portal protein [Chloroflexota bacterium]|nr:phage portal protein [Chloroflexota bacterium]
MVSPLLSVMTAGVGSSANAAIAGAHRAAWHTADDDVRLQRYRRFLDFDNGKHDVGRLGFGQTPIVANYARVFVRKGASYLFPEPVAIAVDAPDDSPSATTAAARIEAALTHVAHENDLGAADLATAIDAGVLGDGAFKVTWQDSQQRAAGSRQNDVESAARRLLPATGSVRIVPVDVQTLFVESAPDDVRRMRVVRQVRVVPRTAAEVTYSVSLIAGTTANVMVVEEWSDTTYRVLVDDVPVHEGANPYGFIPYLIFPNTPRPHEFWGVSDLADILEVNRALDRRLSILAQILELSGNPVTVLENVTGAQGVSVAPGALWELPENSKAYLLDLLAGGSVEQHLRYIEALYRIMDDLGEMPRMSFGEAGQARSGIALTVQLQPVVQKTNRKRLIWGAIVQRRAELALRLLIQRHALDLGPYTLDDFTLRAVWAPILPVDSKQ